LFAKQVIDFPFEDETIMIDILPLIKELTSAPGISGYEAGVRPIIEKAWKPFTDELTVSRLGSLHGFQKGTGKEPRPGIMVATHMDAIGLMVSAVIDGFLRLSSIGGIDVRVLPGQIVTVYGRKELPGLIVPTPARLQPSNVLGGSVPLEYLLVDVGLLPDEVSQLVRVGDLVSFAQQPFEVGGEAVVGHTLDDRACIAALTSCLDLLHDRPHLWDVWAVATVQEEVTMAGALTSAYQIHPSLCLTIDVTFGREPKSPSYLSFPVGEGPTLMLGPITHPYLNKVMQELAERLEIPLTMEPAPRYSATDSDAMQIVAEGIPNVILGVPLRYMHTPVEMVKVKDLTRVARLAAEFIAQLDESFMDRLAWED
jgi:tetrahedral aminopeptidase